MSLSKPIPERHLLTLAQKLELIRKADSSSQRKLAQEFHCSLGTVNNILKWKDEVLQQGAENANSNCFQIKVRRTDNDEINKLMWQFFILCCSKNAPVTGSL